MALHLRRALGDGSTAVVVVSERDDGDLGPDADGVGERRRRLAGGRSAAWARQQHGAQAARSTDDRPVAGAAVDILITEELDHALTVVAADCVLVALFGPGCCVVVHAGWRGLLAGAVEEGFRSLPAGCELAVVGPAIEPDRYEFGVDDLRRLVDARGLRVAATTSDGRPAADVVGEVVATLRDAGVGEVVRVGGCTSDERWCSHRLRTDRCRHGLLAWREPRAGAA